MPTPGYRLRISRAVRMPSSVNVGGMRMSRMTTSGGLALMAASSSAPEVRWRSPRRRVSEEQGQAAAEQPGVFGDRYPHGILP